MEKYLCNIDKFKSEKNVFKLILIVNRNLTISYNNQQGIIQFKYIIDLIRPLSIKWWIF